MHKKSLNARLATARRNLRGTQICRGKAWAAFNRACDTITPGRDETEFRIRDFRRLQAEEKTEKAILAALKRELALPLSQLP